MKHLFTILILLWGSLLLAQDDSTEVDSPEDSVDYDFKPISPERAKHFFLDFELGYANSDHEVIGNKYPELVSCRAEHEKKIKSPIAEFKVGYQIKWWWSVSAGVQYFQTGFNFSETKNLQDSLPIDIVIGCDPYGADNPSFGFMYTGFYDPRFLTYVKGSSPDQANLNIKLRYHYVALPVTTEFSVFVLTARNLRFRMFATGTASPNYMIKQRYDVSFKQDDWTYVERDSVGIPASFIRRWNVGAGFGVGFSFLIRKKVEMRMEFGRQDQLFYLFNWRMYTGDAYQEKHGIYTAKISLRYYLGDS